MRAMPGLVPLVTILILAACENDLLTEDPESFSTTETFFRTASDVESASVASYAPLTGGTGGLFDFLNLSGLELPSDQGTSPAFDPSPRAILVDHMVLTSGTEAVTGSWAPLYQIVFRSNLLLERAPAVSMSEGRKTLLMAEARYLRGWAYLQLTKRYADVPLLLKESEHLAEELTRAPVDQVHAQAARDLMDAAAALPATRPSAEWGRPTRGAAWMALADLHLWRATALAKGAPAYQEAADWSRRIIDSSVYALNDDYISTFLPSNKGNAEMIWVASASGANARSSSSLGQVYGPRDLVSGQGGGFGIVMPTAWHYDSYPAGDYRKEVGYRTGGCNPFGSCVPRFRAGPAVWKYRSSNQDVPLGLSDVDFPIYRYAEALLIYAEAQNELGNSAEAIRHVNMVRARARRGSGSQTRPEPADLTANLSRLQAREAIYMERNWELAHEGKRWFDLVRRDGIEPGYWESELRAHDPVSTALGPIRPHLKVWPLPQTEVDAMPSLTQNPGY